MRNATRLLVAGLASVAIGGTAFAQGDPPQGGEPDGATATDPGATPPEGAPADPAAAPPAEEAPVATGRWARDIISRVLTYPKGLAAVGVDITNATSAFFDPALIKVGAGYGITDDFELNYASYAFPTNDAGKGSIDFGIGYKLVRGAMDGKLEAIARAATGYNLLAEGMNPLALGVHAQYNITPKIAVITPGGQFSIGLAEVAPDVTPMFFQLPVALGFQATPLLYLQADLTLFQIKIADYENVFIFDDYLPLTLSAYYNVMPALDVYGQFASTNFLTPGEVGDTLTINVGARYYIGDL